MTLSVHWWRLWKAEKAMREARRHFAASQVHIDRAREIIEGRLP